MAKKFSRSYVLSSGKHPWRICPIGYHWVNKHPRKEDKDSIVLVKGHCRRNPSNKDVLEIDEIQEISQVFISMLSKEDLPIANNLGFGKKGNKYDELIGLWTKYWNDVFAPSEKLDPNLVKALMATESGFQEVPADAPRGHKAIGIMQLMPETVKYLSSPKELKDFHLDLTQREAWDPAVNIASSVRWLFRKREVGEARLKRKLTWIEVIEEYKGITGDQSEDANKIRKNFNKYLASLRATK
jgi:hypothetical protein